MKFRVGACALLICLAGCSSEDANTKFGDLVGSASPTASGAKQARNVPVARNPADSIANAPDRGALVSYKNNGAASKQEGAYTWFPIAISEEHALRAVATGQMTIPSPDGSQVKLRYERHVEHPDGNWTWIGRVEGGDQNQEAILTFGERAVYGTVPQAAGAPALSLQTRSGVLWAVVADPSKVVSPNKGTNDVMVPPALALRASLASVAAKAQVTQKAVAAGAPATAANTIDVAIGYTQGFATAQGGQSAAVTRLTFLIEVGNQSFTNSLINGHLRLVNSVQVNYADDTANQAALSQLTGHNGTSAVTVPAALIPIRTARDQYGADLAVLVRRFQQPENLGCGIAWLNGANQMPINPAEDDDFGFAVISDGSDTGTDGLTYFCAQETLVHELAHLMGSAHDRDNSKIVDSNPPGGANLQFGRYAYSFGMKTNSANGNFYTIMAYGDDNQNFYRTFSSPLVARCGSAGNLACGVTDQTDNARSLNQTIPVVATFRSTVVPHTGSGIPYDINGDGRSDIFWRDQPIQQFSHWAMNGTAIISSIGKVMDGTYTMSGSGDFNGDGVADILWINTVARYVVIWQSDGNGDYQQLETGGYAAGLKFSGIGDFNRDGRADLLWHNTTANQMIYWSMNGRIATPSAGFAMPGWYDIIAVGDFNADGFSDVAYASASDVNLYVNNAGTSFGGRFLAYRPAGWTLLGAADSNGDRSSDLYWRNDANGTLTYWAISANSVVSTHTYTPSQVLTFAAFGDYNGDGRADILWNRAEWRQLSMWTSQSSGNYLAAVVGYYPAGWAVVR